MRSKEAEQFTAQIRALKDRAGISFEKLAKQTGISSSSLHRYCAGTKIPTGYGVVHTFAKACGASNEELRELHRLWALADAARSSTPVPTRRRPLMLATVLVTVLAAIAATAVALLGATDEPEPTGVTARVRVFNVEKACRNRSERVPGCSIGLAADPRLNYDARNVVSHRVWHEDALQAGCVLYDGDEVTDEIGTKSTRWYRVHLDDAPHGQAWLSGIRTRDHPALPTCRV